MTETNYHIIDCITAPCSETSPMDSEGMLNQYINSNYGSTDTNTKKATTDDNGVWGITLKSEVSKMTVSNITILVPTSEFANYTVNDQPGTSQKVNAFQRLLVVIVNMFKDVYPSYFRN